MSFAKAVIATSLAFNEISNKLVETFLGVKKHLQKSDGKSKNQVAVFVPPKTIFSEILFGDEPEVLDSIDENNNVEYTTSK